MKVSFFKKVTDTAPKLNKDVGYFLDRIKDGASKELVEKIRITEDETEQKFLKAQLPIICFNGVFNTRSKSGLKKSSGLMVLDFDDFTTLDQAKEFKKNIKSDKHVFSAWISPRNGVKLLYRIQSVNNDNEFKNIFKAIQENFPNLDQSGKDISRACFESYDPLIYVNLDAEIYTPQIQITELEPIEIGDVTNIPINDQDVIANKLVIWFQKHYDRNNRNNSVFKLAASFNDFGISKQTAMTYCSRYSENGFPVAEITSIVNSAYKHTAQFSTKFFEDKPRKKKLMVMVMSGKKEKDIQQQFSDIDAEKLNNEINIIKENTKINEFWEYSSDGKLQINSFKMKLYLQSLNYYKYYPVGNDKTFVFISKAENFLEEVNEYKIKESCD